MAEYLSQKELIKKIESNLNQLEAGALDLLSIEAHLDLVRELYERTIVLRYKAFEHHSSVQIAVSEAPLVEEIAPVIEAQEAHEEIISSERIDSLEFSDNVFTEEKETEPEIEFDFFSSPEPEIPEEPTTEAPATDFFSSETTDLLKNEAPESTYEEPDSEPTEPAVIPEDRFVAEEISSPESSAFVHKVFEVEREIRNQIGFNSLPSLIGSFGLNERLLYINELFDGSSESFSESIKHLDARSNLSEAADYVENLAGKFNWDIESETVEEFIQKLCRRYA
ncbi:hypothetical protein H9Y05_05815 [Crocinitomicaceae bacterium CZZ-1]|uniref:Uncharacterized protein n=1 Tax=Taishania pollutisoli TaxID=2766479 RepID=A0A8J6PI24_9FLAO|nr:hypothetical protein [Taishania pollutisoli]MBC9811991.1 hypothetical protein [Taishania pollutisoli]